MSRTNPTLPFPILSPKYPHIHLKFSSLPHLCHRDPHSKTLTLQSSPTVTFLGFANRKKLGFGARAENGDGEIKKAGDEDDDGRGQSTMPERFRFSVQDVPDPPLRWPWFLALAVLAYSWRTVLWELSNWKKTALGITHFIGYLLKLALALIFHFIGDPITSMIRFIETTIYTVRSFYSSIVAYAPIPELTTTIILTSAVIAIAEATSPDSVTTQPYLLTFSGLVGFAAIRGLISEPLFWTLLLGLFSFARFVKKRDYVTSSLPVAAVVAAVGAPWVRVAVMALYLGLAISHHWKKLPEGKVESEEVDALSRELPVPLLAVALAIGIKIAAKWAGTRHLTWMIV